MCGHFSPERFLQLGNNPKHIPVVFPNIYIYIHSFSMSSINVPYWPYWSSSSRRKTSTNFFDDSYWFIMFPIEIASFDVSHPVWLVESWPSKPHHSQQGPAHGFTMIMTGHGQPRTVIWSIRDITPPMRTSFTARPWTSFRCQISARLKSWCRTYPCWLLVSSALNYTSDGQLRCADAMILWWLHNPLVN